MGWFSDAVDSVGGAIKDTVSKPVKVVRDVVDEAEEAVDDIADAAADLGRDIGSGVADVGGSFVDGVTHVVRPIGGMAWDVAGTGWDAGKYLGARGVEMIGAGAAQVGPAISLTGEIANAATLGLGDDVLNAVDDTVLDAVDEVTGGVIDIDYDDGSFTADVGIDDVVNIGLSVGEDGIATESGVIGGNIGLGLGDEGLAIHGEGGIDQFPLPYFDGHVSVDPDGNVMSNGTLQGPIPIPAGDGLLYGKASGGFQRSEDGWMVAGEAEGIYVRSDGTRITGEAGLAYAENEDGSAFSANVSGSATTKYGEVGGGLGYQRIEQDGEVLETFEAEGHARGFGMEASAEAKYLGVETDEGSISAWETDSSFTGFDADRLAALGARLLGEDGQVPDSVDGLVDQLGAGATSALLENADQADLQHMVAGLGEQGAANLIHKLGDDGTASRFLEQLTPESAAELVAKAGDSGGVEDLLEGLTPQQTAALVSRLAAPEAQAAADPPVAAGDDLLGVDGPLDEVATAAGVQPIDGGDGSAPTVVADTGLGLADPVMVEEPQPEAPAVEEPPAPEPEPTAFEASIESADAMEDSMDDLFEGLD